MTKQIYNKKTKIVLNKLKQYTDGLTFKEIERYTKLTKMQLIPIIAELKGADVINVRRIGTTDLITLFK